MSTPTPSPELLHERDKQHAEWLTRLEARISQLEQRVWVAMGVLSAVSMGAGAVGWGGDRAPAPPPAPIPIVGSR